MVSHLLGLARYVLGHIPSRAPGTVARRLVLRANAARDMRQWQVASALYEEALRLTPTARIHKQCGHMLKESGQFDAAERHYREAERLNPGDADLILQVGHFEMVRGDLAAAATAYRRTLAMKPGWDEPLEGLARLRAVGDNAAAQNVGTAVVPELLPNDAARPHTYRETIQIRRLGSVRQRADGYGRILRGIEAIRGFCISAVPLSEIVVALGDTEIARRPLVAAPLPGGNLKHVFNLWLDFSDMSRGASTLELRFVDHRGRTRTHRAAVELLEPVREIDLPSSDTIVDPPTVAGTPLVASINARPSVIHPSARSPVEGPVSGIFVQRIDQLGDLIISVPALRRLRAIFPDARISLLVSQANIDFARTLEVVDELLGVEVTIQEDGSRAVSRSAQEALLAQLQERRFDLAIDLSQGSESRPLLRLSGAPFTCGFRSATAPWLSASFDLDVPDPMNRLETCSPSRKLLAMIDALGRLHDRLSPPPMPRRNLAIVQRYRLDARPYVLLHTGARLEMNRWPFFGELAQRLLDQTEFDVALFGGETYPEAIPSHRLHRIDGILPFPHFDALVAGCVVFVGNDSGPKHLAAIRGVPTISLHLARLNWTEWGQEGRGSIISRRVPCAGCGIERDPDECGMDFACLRHIRPEEVLAEIVRLAGESTAAAEIA